MSMPARMAWKRKAECIASRTTSLPRNEKDRFDTPPETLAPGQAAFDPARRLDERDGVAVVLLDAGRDGEDVGVEDDVGRREADAVHEEQA
jgi:hypothetical protein